MQTLLVPPATRSGICLVAVGPLLPTYRRRPAITFSSPNFFASLETRKPKPLISPFASWNPLNVERSKLLLSRVSSSSSSSVSPGSTSPNDDSDKAKLAQAPPRANVVKSLKNGIVLNLLGMGAAILGMQATVGLLVAKALTSSTTPYYQGIAPGSSPVLALDVFLVQASANTILSHFLGLVFSLELLRSVTLPNTESIPIPKLA
ncbi:hypothetical protein Godav_014470 [Gossypium davidsonii]|uniref:Uncharacterized protein n=1 Tax=Gossypium davidsonii TaxID=34287 RepID=A0A7J8RK66_GOSDV|nr:hypothetical protein [Gossypium davidsonii]